jgi:hypothetical protein
LVLLDFIRAFDRWECIEVTEVRKALVKAL